MPEESAVMDPITEAQDESSVLDSFDYTKYVECFPEGTEEYFTRVFSNHEFGWKRRATVVLKIAQKRSEVQDLQEYLLTLSQTVPRSHTPKSAVIDPRAGLSAFLQSLTPEKLQQLCTEKSVSYASFMKPNSPDKPGLIEALCDEMLS